MKTAGMVGALSAEGQSVAPTRELDAASPAAQRDCRGPRLSNRVARLRLIAKLAGLTAVLVLFAAAPALAGTTHAYTGTAFGPDGSSGTTFTASNPQDVTVDPSNGDIYVIDSAATPPAVYRFDSTHQPKNFSALGTNTLDGAAADPANVNCATTPTDCDATPDNGFLFSAGVGDGYYSQVAVDRSGGVTDGDIYVTDTFHAKVDIFDNAGNYLGQLTGSHTSYGAFGPVCGVAVDSAGNLYVADRDQNFVHKFNVAVGLPASNPVADNDWVRDFYATAPCSLALDANGNFYSASPYGGAFAHDPFGNEAMVDGNAARAVAIDPTTGHLFVAEPDRVAEYDVSTFGAATRLGSFAGSTTPGGVAEDGTAGAIYVSDTAATGGTDATAQQVAIFSGTAAAIPDAVTDAPDAVTDTTVTLHGQVNPNGIGVTDCHFEFQNAAAPDAPCAEDLSASTDTSPDPVHADVTGLTAATTYQARLVASNANGTSTGDWQSFTTAGAPIVDGQPFASAITTTTATLNATVNPNDAQPTNPAATPTSCVFKYGTTDYGTSVPCNPAQLSGVGDQPVTADLTGLTPGTDYQFEVVVNNGIGGDANHDVISQSTFKTAPAAAPYADNVTAVSATLHGVVDAAGQFTSYHFEYGTTTAYGTSTEDKFLGDFTEGEQAVSAQIKNLTPATTYHVRIVATRNGQTVTGADGTFTTAVPPVAVVGDTTDITTTSAVVHGTVDTHGLGGTYHIEVESEDTGHFDLTPTTSLPAVSGAVPVSASFTGLPSGEKIDVTIWVDSGGASGVSAPGSFTTATVPVVSVQRQPDNPAPYGCTNPQLDAVKFAAPGQPLTLNGSDLGVGGEVTVGSEQVDPDRWSATAVVFTVPDDITAGKVDIKVNCGKDSNAVTAVVPDNSFAIVSETTRGKVGKLTLRLPGAGLVTVAGKYLHAKRAVASKGGLLRLSIPLNKAGIKALKRSRSRRLNADATITFTPVGGAPNSQTESPAFTFKRR